MVWCLTFSPRGRTLASGGFDNRVHLFDSGSGALRKTLTGHTDVVTSLVFAPDTSRLISGSYDKTFKVWNAQAPRVSPIITIREHSGLTRLAIFTPDGRQMITSGHDKQILVWDTATGKIVQRWGVPDGSGIASGIVSPDGKLLAVTTLTGGHVWLLDMESGREAGRIAIPNVEMRSIAFTPDGKRLIVAARVDKSVRILDVVERKEIMALPHPMGSDGVAVSPDGKLLATTTGDYRERKKSGEVLLWDLESGKQLAALQRPGAGERFTQLQFSHDGKLLAVGSSNSQVCLWDVATRKELVPLGHPSGVYSVTFLANGKQLAACDYSGAVILWNLATFSKAMVYAGHGPREPKKPQKMAYWVSSSPDGSLIASAGHDGTIRLWPTSATAAKNKLRIWGPATQAQHALDFDGKDQYVSINKLRYDGSHGITIEAVVNPRSLKQSTVCADFEQAGVGLQLSGTNRWKFNVWTGGDYRRVFSDEPAEVGKPVQLAAVYDGKLLRLFVNGRLQRTTARVIGEFKASGLPFYVGANPAPGGSYNSGRGFDGQIHAIRISKGARYTRSYDPPNIFTRDESTLVLLHLSEGAGQQVRDEAGNGYHGTLHGGKWVTARPASFEPLQRALATLPAHKSSARFVLFSPDGTKLYSGGMDWRIKVYDLNSGKMTAEMTQGAGIVSGALSPDGKILATGGWGKIIRLWDTTTNKLLSTLKAPVDGAIRKLAFTPDGKTLVSGCHLGHVRFWDVEAGKELRSLPKHPFMITGLAISPDGKLLATATGDYLKPNMKGPLRMWDLDTGKEIANLDIGEEGCPHSLCFSRDGNTLIACGTKKQLHLWDLRERKPRVTLRSLASGCTATSLMSDGKLLSSGHFSGSLLLWNLATGNQVGTFNGHEKHITSIANSPDGSLLATASMKDGIIKLWAIQTGSDENSTGSDGSDKKTSTAARVRGWASATASQSDTTAKQ